jgi:hypothetical protein
VYVGLFIGILYVSKKYEDKKIIKILPVILMVMIGLIGILGYMAGIGYLNM